MRTRLYNMLIKYADTFHEVVPLNKAKDKLLKMDFSKSNEALTEEILGNTEMFTDYVHQLLSNKKYKYGIGGYDELRTVYKRSRVFDAVGEPRRLHLGVDIWGPAGTPVYAPIGGVIHSFAFNDDFGDYGATILLQHQLDGFAFYTLYGHLSLKDIAGLQEGQYITRGMEFAHFGEPHENGNWPPHLHFQVIDEIHEYWGDYPGVCRFSERKSFLANSPDPDAILQMVEHAR